MARAVPSHSIVITKAPERRLSDFRREVLDTLEEELSRGCRNRLVLVVNEIVANILRHSQPVASEIRIDFTARDDRPCCVIRDNGGSFARFKSVWEGLGAKPFFGGSCIGLSLVKSFFPEARYKPKNARQKFNEFILPLDRDDPRDLPAFFGKDKEETCRSRTIT